MTSRDSDGTPEQDSQAFPPPPPLPGVPPVPEQRPVAPTGYFPAAPTSSPGAVPAPVAAPTPWTPDAANSTAAYPAEQQPTVPFGAPPAGGGPAAQWNTQWESVEPAPRKSRKGLWISLAAAAVVIAGGAVAAVFIFQGIAADERAKREAAAVAPAEEYFTALERGDVEVIKAHLANTTPEGIPLVADEALSAALEAAPVTDVVVTLDSLDEEGENAMVSVSYSQAGAPYSQQLTMSDEDGDGTFTTRDIVPVTLSAPNLSAFEIRVNGAAAESTSQSVIPGHYVFTTVTENFTLEGETEVTILPDAEPTQLDFSVALTDEGLGKFRQAVRGAVDACVASNLLDPGCGGLDLPQSTPEGTLTEGTVVRTLPAETAAALDALQPILSGSTTAVSSGYVGIVDTSFDCVIDGVELTGCTMVLTPTIFGATVDMADPALPVTWY